jgi:hypothetical protein
MLSALRQHYDVGIRSLRLIALSVIPDHAFFDG